MIQYMILLLDKMVTSLETSKKIQALGFLQETHFYWTDLEHIGEGHVIRAHESGWYVTYGSLEELEKGHYIPAYTSSEIAEMLPYNYTTERLDGSIANFACNKPESKDDADDGYIIYADTEAESRGKMLIYLKEQNLL